MSTPSVYQLDLKWIQDDAKAEASFAIPPGVTALIGPSGAGKTSIARMLAGLDTPQSGFIKKGQSTIFDSETGTDTPPARRKIGYVTQEPALFPTMSVQENILIGAQLEPDALRQLYEMTGVTALLKRNPRTLSGGEARRVSIARAMATAPEFLILDEPMNGLDPKRRKNLLTDIRRLSKQSSTPTLIITHQIEEMLIAADHAILMANGHCLLSGSIEDVLSSPETARHLDIDDPGSIATAIVTGRQDGLLKARVGHQTVWLADDGEPEGSLIKLRILARDIGIALSLQQNISVLNQLQGTILSMTPQGAEILVLLQLEDSDSTLTARITAKSAAHLALKEGKNICALIKAVAVKELMMG